MPSASVTDEKTSPLLLIRSTPFCAVFDFVTSTTVTAFSSVALSAVTSK